MEPSFLKIQEESIGQTFNCLSPHMDKMVGANEEWTEAHIKYVVEGINEDVHNPNHPQITNKGGSSYSFLISKRTKVLALVFEKI